MHSEVKLASLRTRQRAVLVEVELPIVIGPLIEATASAAAKCPPRKNDIACGQIAGLDELGVIAFVLGAPRIDHRRAVLCSAQDAEPSETSRQRRFAVV